MKKLYYAGSVLIAVGLACMNVAMYKQGQEDLKNETVWTEADKQVLGEKTETA